MKKYFFITYIAFFLSISLQAAPVKISGVATDYAGEEIKLMTYIEEISYSEEELANTVVAADGFFSLEVEINSVKSCFIPLGIYNGNIFIEPGREYTVAFPAYKKKTLAQSLDPYFKPTTVLLQQVNPDADNINVQLLAFNIVMDDCFSYHLAVDNRDSIVRTITALENSVDKASNPFLRQYVESKCALLTRFAENHPLDWGIREFLNPMDIDCNNAGFWEAFNGFFSGIFSGYEGSEEQIYFKKAITMSDINALFVILERRYGLTNIPLRELVVIKGLYDASFSAAYNRDAVYSTLLNLSPFITNPQNKNIYSIILNKLNQAKKGTVIPDVEVLDEKGNPVNLKSLFEQKYMYLNFCNTNIERSKQDLIFLEKLSQTYKERLQIINVFVFEDEPAMMHFAKRHKLKNRCVNWNNKEELIDFFNVKVLPFYYLVDKQGTIIMSPAPTPDEHFDHYFERFIQQEVIEEYQQRRAKETEWIHPIEN